MRYYHMFPCAIPHRRADYPRVTHPSAASRPEGLFARLACLKRAASVRSEPGSNSPLSIPDHEDQANIFDYSFLPFPELAYFSFLPFVYRIDRSSSASLLFPFAHAVKKLFNSLLSKLRQLSISCFSLSTAFKDFLSFSSPFILATAKQFTLLSLPCKVLF